MSFKPIAAVAGLLFALSGCAVTPPGQDALRQAVANPARTPAFVARDEARKPYEVLRFIGVQPGHTVVEISPGAGYWTEILAPYLRERGTYYAAQYPRDGATGRAYYRERYDAYRAKLDANPALYDKVKVTAFGNGSYDIAPPGSADVVLTFRNLHNWLQDGYADAALASFYKALKPGGILGIEAHRGRTDVPQDPRAANGYVRQDYAIQLAQKAGFVFVGSSEVLANPRDTKDHPAGVWTLPPTYRLGDKDKARYAAIGEADGFLLTFRKP